MIFVTVGTQKFPMNRLLEEMDRLAGGLNESIFIQTGHSDYCPKHCDYAPFLEKKKMQQKMAECSVMICHAGTGSILTALQLDCKVIVLPRLKSYGEHVDDHQLEIAQSFAQAGYVLMAEDVNELAELLERSRTWEPKKFVSNREKFTRLIIDILEKK